MNSSTYAVVTAAVCLFSILLALCSGVVGLVGGGKVTRVESSTSYWLVVVAELVSGASLLALVARI